MNQTKKRLHIINLAISIADTETIQLQVLKLSLLKTDIKIQEIINGLQAEEFAKTQALITEYIETPTEEILQRSSQKEMPVQNESDQAIIEEFDLFITTPEEEEKGEKELFDFNKLQSADTQQEEAIDFDALLTIEPNDILPDNIELNIDHVEKDTFFETSQDSSESHINIDIIPKDTFFDTDETLTAQNEPKKEIHANAIYEESVPVSKKDENKIIQEVSKQNPLPTEDTEESRYSAISYIDQKFKNMQIQYPPVHESKENFTSVNAWLLQISNKGYSDHEIEEMIGHITKLSEANKLAEAAQLLLITGATKSKFAQFMLARALYKGTILQKNLPEAFTLINRLAMDDNYPEAICDLAQFYEYGIGIDRDKNKAEILYEEAMNLGIQRATAHYHRVQKQNKGFFSAFKK
jgi:hypothetical protein